MPSSSLQLVPTASADDLRDAASKILGAPEMTAKRPADWAGWNERVDSFADARARVEDGDTGADGHVGVAPAAAYDEDDAMIAALEKKLGGTKKKSASSGLVVRCGDDSSASFGAYMALIDVTGDGRDDVVAPDIGLFGFSGGVYLFVAPE